MQRQDKTPLHALLRDCASAQQLIDFIEEHGEDQAAAYARTIDPKAGLPIHLVDDLDLDERDEELIYQLLIALTNKNAKSRPFSQAIEQHELQARFGYLPGTKHEFALSMARTVTNLARATMWASTTHPMINGCDTQTFQAIQNSIKSVHLNSLSQTSEILLASDDFHFQERQDDKVKLVVKLNAELYERYLASRAKIYLEAGVGNCGDLCLLARYFLNLYYKNEMAEHEINADIYLITNGDHAILVIRVGNQMPLELNHEVIVCDVLNGEIFPGNLAAEYLQDHVPASIFITRLQEHRHYNFYVPWNPNTQPLKKFNQDAIEIIFWNKSNDFIEEFSKTIDNPKDFYLFRESLEDYIYLALKKELVTQNEILQFKNRIAALNIIFSRRNIMQLLSAKLFRVGDLAKMHDVEIDHYLQWSATRINSDNRIVFNQHLTFLASNSSAPAIAEPPELRHIRNC